MRSVPIPSGFIIKIERGEKVMDQLTAFCAANNITSGSLQGIGAVEWISCGYYDLEKRVYNFIQYEELVEVVNFSGNVALKEGVPFVHAHAVFSRADNSTFGGHVEEMRVGVVLEVHLVTEPVVVIRKFDEDTGLYLMDLPPAV